jgi:4-amino-4-deoxy-L-arabinose transferase-like glycosyltransferase
MVDAVRTDSPAAVVASPKAGARLLDSKDRDVFEVFLWVALAAAFVHAIYFLLVGINNPALDNFSFRQTQTALTAYWFWREGFRFAYETPVVGYPWSIPFEFPLYQALVALLRHGGVPIEIGGRLVNFGFYVGTIYPLRMLSKSLRLGRTTWLVAALLFLTSPLYVFWGRTVMIESTALFFSVLALAWVAKYLDNPRGRTLALVFVIASLAALVKATTFPAYAFLAGLLVLSGAVRVWCRDRSAASFFAAIAPLLVLAAAFAVAEAWVWFTDQTKLHNPIGTLLTSGNLATFNFGTWGERWGSALWVDAVLGRALPDIFGYGALVAIVAGAGALQDRRTALLAGAALSGFLLPFLIFAHLHFVHAYYQNANALLAIVAVAIGIAAIKHRGRPAFAAISTIVLVVAQVSSFEKVYAPIIRANLTTQKEYIISMAAKQYVAADDALLILGLDWSSAVPFYSERKSLALPNWTPAPLMKQILDNPESFLGGKRLGGVVYCGAGSNRGQAPLVTAFIAGRTVISEAGECKLLSAARP